MYAERPAFLPWRVCILPLRPGRLDQYGASSTRHSMCKWGDWISKIENVSLRVVVYALWFGMTSCPGNIRRPRFRSRRVPWYSSNVIRSHNSYAFSPLRTSYKSLACRVAKPLSGEYIKPWVGQALVTSPQNPTLTLLRVAEFRSLGPPFISTAANSSIGLYPPTTRHICFTTGISTLADHLPYVTLRHFCPGRLEPGSSPAQLRLRSCSPC